MDPEDFDLDLSVDAAWRQFQDSLGDIVASIDDSDDLHIDADQREEHPGCGRLSFHADAPGEVTVRAAGNPELAPADQLGADQVACLKTAGWEQQPDGSFTMTRSQDDANDLAAASVVALREAYGVQHPVFLVPDQLAEVLLPQDRLPELASGERRTVVVEPRNATELDAMIGVALQDMFGYAPLRDHQGDYALRHGSVMVFVRATPDANEVIVFSVIVHDVDGRSRAVEVLNDFNAESRFVRFELIRDQVFVQMSLLARPFVPAHLRQAVRLVATLADGVDEALAQRLRGRTTFGEIGE